MNRADGQTFQVPDKANGATGFPAMNPVGFAHGEVDRDRLCGCRVPLVLDRDSGKWLHLNTMSRCPERTRDV